jgi:hypothetical protein
MKKYVSPEVEVVQLELMQAVLIDSAGGSMIGDTTPTVDDPTDDDRR